MRPNPVVANGFIHTEEVLTIDRPKSAVYELWSATPTGAITITLPSTYTLSTKPTIYDIVIVHDVIKKSEHYRVLHYNSFASALNRVWYMGDEAPHDVRMTINDEGLPTIYIGETSTVWRYPAVYVDRVTVHSPTGVENYENLDDGWDLSISSSFEGSPITVPFLDTYFAGGVSLSPGAATSDTDQFLVSDGGFIKYRTASEIISDLGISDIYIKDGGNNFGYAPSIGSNDNYDVIFERANTEVARFQSNGQADFTSAISNGNVAQFDGTLPTTNGHSKKIVIQGANSSLAGFGALYEGTLGSYTAALYSTTGGIMNTNPGIKLQGDNSLIVQNTSGIEIAGFRNTRSDLSRRLLISGSGAKNANDAAQLTLSNPSTFQSATLYLDNSTGGLEIDATLSTTKGRTVGAWKSISNTTTTILSTEYNIKLTASTGTAQATLPASPIEGEQHIIYVANNTHSNPLVFSNGKQIADPGTGTLVTSFATGGLYKTYLFTYDSTLGTSGAWTVIN